MAQRVKIKGELRDLAGILDLLPERKRRIRAASDAAPAPDYISELVRGLHPGTIALKVTKTKKETETARTFRLEPDANAGTTGLPAFRPGQYMSFKFDIGGALVTRPYSICSSPAEALDQNFMEVTVRQKPGGLVSGHIWKTWRAGAKVSAHGPAGFFYYDDLRDGRDIVGLVGGCGMTPFRSMIKDLIDNDNDMNITLLYGIRTPDDIIYKKEIPSLITQAGGRVAVHYVCSEPDKKWKGAKGFLTRGVIKELAGDPSGKTFFVCGPQPMYTFLDKELKPWRIPQRRLRREVFGEPTDVSTFKGYPKKIAGKTFAIKVHVGDEMAEIPAAAGESVLVSLERARIAPPSQCRSGECGYCNTLLMSGDIFVIPENDGRRMATAEHGYFHPCASFPVSDIEVRVMRE